MREINYINLICKKLYKIHRSFRKTLMKNLLQQKKKKIMKNNINIVNNKLKKKVIQTLELKAILKIL